MKVTVFHGSPRIGNTHKATELFLDGMRTCGDIEITEFFLPQALPELCLGCQLCFAGEREVCPHAQHVTPIYEAILDADALVFTTPHHGASSMSGGMKSLLDHLDFLTMNVAPRAELFRKRAFILTTAAGSTSAIAPLRTCLKRWGINRVHSLGIRMLTNEWSAMPASRQQRIKVRLYRRAARFYKTRVKRPYISTVFTYYISAFILRLFVGRDAYPYKYWTTNGYFEKRPF